MADACDILCAGASHWDVVGRSPWRVAHGGDVPGETVRAPGGVALNIARALARAGLRPALLGAVGGDADGVELMAALRADGVATGHLRRLDGCRTDRYVAVEDPSGLVAAVADAATLEAAGDAILAPLGRGGVFAGWRGPVVLDGNLPAAVLGAATRLPGLAAASLILVPPSPAKAARLRVLFGHPRLTVYANRLEAAALTGSDPTDAPAAAHALRAAGIARAIVTDGESVAADSGAHGVVTRIPPAVVPARVTGAGDSFIAAHVAAVLRGAPPEVALQAALDGAAAWLGGAA